MYTIHICQVNTARQNLIIYLGFLVYIKYLCLLRAEWFALSTLEIFLFSLKCCDYLKQECSFLLICLLWVDNCVSYWVEEVDLISQSNGIVNTKALAIIIFCYECLWWKKIKIQRLRFISVYFSRSWSCQTHAKTCKQIFKLGYFKGFFSGVPLKTNLYT